MTQATLTAQAGRTATVTRDTVEQPSLWERLALASGMGFVACLLAAAFFFPLPPFDAPAAELADWYARNRDAIFAQAYVRGIGGLLQLIFVAALVGVIRRAEGGIGTLGLLAFAGGVMHTLAMNLANAVGVAAALAAGEGIDPAMVGALHTLAESFLGLEAFPNALLAGTAGVALLRTRAVSRWVAALVLAAAAVYLLGAGAFPGSPLLPVAFIGLPMEFLWFSVASAALVARSFARRPAPQPQIATA